RSEVCTPVSLVVELQPQLRAAGVSATVTLFFTTLWRYVAPAIMRIWPFTSSNRASWCTSQAKKSSTDTNFCGTAFIATMPWFPRRLAREPQASNVEVGDAEGVVLDELATRLDEVAHQLAEELIVV